MTPCSRARRHRRSRGLTLIEILVAVAVMTMMTASVWTSFRSTAQSCLLYTSDAADE